MKKLACLLTLLVALAFSAASIYADIALPKSSPTPNEKKAKEYQGEFMVSIDEKAKEPRLLISRSAFNEMRAAFDEENSQNPTVASTFNVSPMQTLVSGLLLSMAFVAGGALLARSKHDKSSKAALGLIIFGLIGAGAGIALANVPPPRITNVTDSWFSKNVLAYGFASGKVKIQISDEMNDSRIVLKVPKTVKNKGKEE